MPKSKNLLTYPDNDYSLATDAVYSTGKSLAQVFESKAEATVWASYYYAWRSALENQVDRLLRIASQVPDKIIIPEMRDKAFRDKMNAQDLSMMRAMPPEDYLEMRRRLYRQAEALSIKKFPFEGKWKAILTIGPGENESLQNAIEALVKDNSEKFDKSDILYKLYLQNGKDS